MLRSQCCKFQKPVYWKLKVLEKKVLSNCTKFFQLRAASSIISEKEFIKHLCEIKACTKLLQTSGLLKNSHSTDLSFIRHNSVINAFINRFFRSSRRSQNRQNDNDQKQTNQSPNDKPPEDEEKMPILARLMFGFWLGFLLYIILKVQTTEDSGNFKFVSWNEFVHDILAKGEVEEIIIRPEAEMAFIKVFPGAIIKGRKVDNEYYALKLADPNKFEEKLRKTEAEIGVRPEKGVPVSYQRENSWISLVFMAIVAISVFILLRNLFSKISVQFNSSDFFANERKAKFIRADLTTAQGKGVSFKDIAGLHEAKIEIMEFVDYLKNPQLYQHLGAKVPKGALLLGPPGCGKTLLAKAVATEAKVPFLVMAGSEFVEMIGGLGASRMRDLFKEARKHAPCIIYIDEIDAVGKKRGGNNWSENAEEEHTLNQLLVEMDGMGTKEGVILLASTNRHEVLDQALLRAGRFDRQVMIDLPTLIERKEIFEIYLQKLKLLKPPVTYAPGLAQMTPGMSGADIANICNEAALFAAREGRKHIDTTNFDYAMERVIAGVAKKSRILSNQEKKVVAYHEAGHAIVGWLLQYTDALLKVSIVPRTNKTLGFALYTPDDKKLHSKEELFERMCMALGGRVAESLIFNSVTSGAQDDLKRVTEMAYGQIKHLGMSEAIGPIAFPIDEDDKFASKPYSKQLSALIDEESRLLVARAYQATEKLLKENRPKLRVIAEALLEKETLSYQDMEELIGPPPFGKKGIILNHVTPPIVSLPS